MTQQINALIALWIITIISLVFIFNQFQNQYQYELETRNRLSQLEEQVNTNVKFLSELRNESDSLNHNLSAEIKQVNSKIYENQIKKALVIMQDGWFNKHQCSFEDVGDYYYGTQILFHCSFADNDSWYLKINIESNTIVKQKYK